MNLKKILVTLTVCLLSVFAMAQKKELKLHEELKPGEPIFSQNGKWVLIMENVAGPKYGQYATFATNNFSLARDKGIMSSNPKTLVGQAKGKATKLGFETWGLEILEYVTPKSYKILSTLKVGKDPVKMIVENDGTVSFFNAKGEKVHTIK